MAHAIETRGLVKSFGQTRALAGIDLTVGLGSVYGLLGPNGAGKTTTIRILATLLAPDGGSATVLGHDVTKEARAVRRTVSLTGQYASVDETSPARRTSCWSPVARPGVKAARRTMLAAFGLRTRRGGRCVRTRAA
jgi:ABC-2 type transport system ATP-binding protein